MNAQPGHAPRSGDAPNVVLIGMPGAGKSTVGVVLAKRMGLAFVDTDILIQSRIGRTLQSVVDRDGYLALRKIEEEVICSFEGRRAVVATGGSAAYSEPAMRHLAGRGRIVFLDAPLDLITERVRDVATRGLARRPGQTLEDLYLERLPLYRRFADVTVPVHPGASQDETAAAVLIALETRCP